MALKAAKKLSDFLGRKRIAKSASRVELTWFPFRQHLFMGVLLRISLQMKIIASFKTWSASGNLKLVKTFLLLFDGKDKSLWLRQDKSDNCNTLNVQNPKRRVKNWFMKTLLLLKKPWKNWIFSNINPLGWSVSKIWIFCPWICYNFWVYTVRIT